MLERNDKQMILLCPNIDEFSLSLTGFNQSDKPHKECESQINFEHLMIRANVNSKYTAKMS